jgi:hypothetical protein
LPNTIRAKKMTARKPGRTPAGFGPGLSANSTSSLIFLENDGRAKASHEPGLPLDECRKVIDILPGLELVGLLLTTTNKSRRNGGGGKPVRVGWGVSEGGGLGGGAVQKFVGVEIHHTEIGYTAKEPELVVQRVRHLDGEGEVQ